MEQQPIKLPTINQVGTGYNTVINKSISFVKEHITGIANVLLFVGIVIYLCCDVAINTTRPKLTLLTDIAFRFFLTTTYWSNMYWSGSNKGHQSPEYISASTYLSAIIENIRKAKKLNEVDGFCVEYIKTELENYRRGLVESVGIDFDEYIKNYQNLSTKEVRHLVHRAGVYAERDAEGNPIGEELRLSDLQKKYICLALNAKPRKLNYNMLMGGQDRARRKGVISASENKLAKTKSASKIIRHLVTAVITGIWGISWAVTAPANIIGTIAVMFLLIVMASVGGWTGGYKNATTGAVRNFTDRADILNIMCENKGIEVVKKDDKKEEQK